MPGRTSVLYQHLIPAIAGCNGDMAVAVKMNEAYQAKILSESSTVIAKAIKEDGLKVVSANYDKVTLGA